jgi:hypothetical protein
MLGNGSVSTVKPNALLWDGPKHLCLPNYTAFAVSMPIKVDVCVYIYVCMSRHNSGTPGAISTKLGTHMAICMCKNLMYVLYTFRREDGVGGGEFG